MSGRGTLLALEEEVKQLNLLILLIASCEVLRSTAQAATWSSHRLKSAATAKY